MVPTRIPSPRYRHCARLVPFQQMFQIKLLLSSSGAHHKCPLCRNCARMVPCPQLFQVQLLLSPSGAHHNRLPVPDCARLVISQQVVQRCRCCFPRMVATTIVLRCQSCARLVLSHQKIDADAITRLTSSSRSQVQCLVNPRCLECRQACPQMKRHQVQVQSAAGAKSVQVQMPLKRAF